MAEPSDLIRCSKEGDRDKVERLIQTGTNIDMKDEVSSYLMNTYLLAYRYWHMILYIYNTIILVIRSVAWQPYTMQSVEVILISPSYWYRQELIWIFRIWLVHTRCFHILYTAVSILISSIILVTHRMAGQHYTLRLIGVILISPSYWYSQGLIWIFRIV